MPVDLEALWREAQSFPRGETTGNYRIGVGARRGQGNYFIEVIATLCREGRPNLDEMEEKLRLIKELKARGYSLICEDDGSISCEMQLPRSRVESEVRALTAT